MAKNFAKIRIKGAPVIDEKDVIGVYGVIETEDEIKAIGIGRASIKSHIEIIKGLKQLTEYMEAQLGEQLSNQLDDDTKSFIDKLIESMKDEAEEDNEDA